MIPPALIALAAKAVGYSDDWELSTGSILADAGDLSPPAGSPPFSTAMALQRLPQLRQASRHRRRCQPVWVFYEFPNELLARFGGFWDPASESHSEAAILTLRSAFSSAIGGSQWATIERRGRAMALANHMPNFDDEFHHLLDRPPAIPRRPWLNITGCHGPGCGGGAFRQLPGGRFHRCPRPRLCSTCIRYGGAVGSHRNGSERPACHAAAIGCAVAMGATQLIASQQAELRRLSEQTTALAAKVDEIQKYRSALASAPVNARRATPPSTEKEDRSRWFSIVIERSFGGGRNLSPPPMPLSLDSRTR